MSDKQKTRYKSYSGVFKNHIITPKDVKRIILQLVTGLKFLHSQNVVQRDLKPENILIVKNKNVKITDLAISKKLKTIKDYYKTNELGTRGWTAPEILKN